MVRASLIAITLAGLLAAFATCCRPVVPPPPTPQASGLAVPDGPPAGADPYSREAVVSRERAMAAGLALAEAAILLGLRFRRQPLTAGGGLGRLAIAAAAVAILFARRPSVFAAPQFWAEDGTIYFPARHHGWAGLWEPQANYLSLIPRAAAAVAALAPVWYAPILYASVAIAVSVAAALKAASPRVGLPLPAIAALAVVLVPKMDEITANVTNAQWFGAVILVLVCVSRPPATLCESAADAAAVLIFGLTGPFVIFALPLLAWRAFRARSAGTGLAAILGAAAAALQLRAYFASHPPPLPAVLASPAQLLAATGYRTGGQLFGLVSPAPAHPMWVGCAGLALYAVFWLIPLRGAIGDLRPALAWFSVCVMAGGFLRYLGVVRIFFEPAYVARYFYLALLFGSWLMIGGLAGGRRRWLAATGAAAALACNAASFRMAPYADLRWTRYAMAITRGDAVLVPINPQPWAFENPGKPGFKE